MIRYHISINNISPSLAEFMSSVSHPNQNLSVRKANLLTPVLPPNHRPGFRQ